VAGVAVAVDSEGTATAAPLGGGAELEGDLLRASVNWYMRSSANSDWAGAFGPPPAIADCRSLTAALAKSPCVAPEGRADCKVRLLFLSCLCTPLRNTHSALTDCAYDSDEPWNFWYSFNDVNASSHRMTSSSESMRFCGGEGRVGSYCGSRESISFIPLGLPPCRPYSAKVLKLANSERCSCFGGSRLIW
jgi:hypothetical protein